MARAFTPRAAATVLAYYNRTGHYLPPERRAFYERFLIESEACLRCGRAIKDPRSLEAWATNGHFGPECVKKKGRA